MLRNRGSTIITPKPDEFGIPIFLLTRDQGFKNSR